MKKQRSLAGITEAAVGSGVVANISGLTFQMNHRRSRQSLLAAGSLE